jgi:hypothetical protein
MPDRRPTWLMWPSDSYPNEVESVRRDSHGHRERHRPSSGAARGGRHPDTPRRSGLRIRLRARCARAPSFVAALLLSFARASSSGAGLQVGAAADSTAPDDDARSTFHEAHEATSRFLTSHLSFALCYSDRIQPLTDPAVSAAATAPRSQYGGGMDARNASTT